MDPARQVPQLQPSELYSSAAGEAALRQLYDATLAGLPFHHDKRFVRTASHGRAHVVVCGPPHAPPLVLWHGATTPALYMLCSPSILPLVERFRLFVPDIPCHAGGRSDPAALDPSTHGHGRWCVEVLQELGLLPTSPHGQGSSGASASSDQPSAGMTSSPHQVAPQPAPLHAGISLGGAMLLDLAVVCPQAIRGAALVAPGRLHPGASWMPASLAVRLALYCLLPCAWTQRLMLACLFDEPGADDPLIQQVKLGIRHLRRYPPSPAAATDAELLRLSAPVFLACCELDVYGAGQGTIARARSLWPDSQLEAMLLPGARHVPSRHSMREVIARMARFFESRVLAGSAASPGVAADG